MMAHHRFISEGWASCPSSLLQAAQQNAQKKLVVVNAGAELPMQSAFDAYTAGIALPVLIGEKDAITHQAEKLGWRLDEGMIIPASGEQEAAQTAANMVREDILSGHKAYGIGAIMKGQLHTDVFMGALLDKTVGIRTGARLVHIFAIFPPDGGAPIMVSDAAVNVTPDHKTKAQSLQQMAAMGRALGIDRPKLAVLSATETPIASMPASLEADEIAHWGKQHIEDADIEGPLSFDLAVSSHSVAVKGIKDNAVAGKADGLLVPEIVSGNILYKALVYVGGGCAAGVVLGGSLPILLTSRADPPQARLASIALAAVMSSTA